MRMSLTQKTVKRKKMMLMLILYDYVFALDIVCIFTLFIHCFHYNVKFQPLCQFCVGISPPHGCSLCGKKHTIVYV